MTKYFKKTKKHDSMRFMNSIETELLEDEEGDIYANTGFEQARRRDMISDSDESFSYLEC